MPDSGRTAQELLVEAQFLRSLAFTTARQQLRETALELAAKYEQQVAEADPQDQG